ASSYRGADQFSWMQGTFCSSGGWFLMSHEQKSDSSKPNLRRSLVLSFAQKYTGFLITLPTIMILSRLLTPAQIGVFSIAMAVTGLIHMLRDFGVSEFIVQHPKIEP